jgi:phage protein D
MPAQTSNYLSLPIVEVEGIGGSEQTRLMADVMEISIEESLNMPAMFTLILHNPYAPSHTDDMGDNTRPWLDNQALSIGKRIKFGFRNSTTEAQEFSEEVVEECLLEGEITAIETHFLEDREAPIIIRGYDFSHRLHRGRYNRSFINMTDSDIVKKIAGETAIKIGTIDSSGSPHDYVFQENQTNMAFLRQRAARLGFELFVQDSKLHFRKPKSQESLNLKWLQDIHSFRVHTTSAEQVNEVEVRGWDYQNKKSIVSTKKTENVVTETGHGKGSQNGTKFRSPSPKMIVVNQPIFSPDEADTIAQALCNELGGEFVFADARAEGNPKIRPGCMVQLEGLGDRYSGKYYVTETRHLYDARIYTTEFKVRGLRGGSLFETLAPQTHLKPGQTFLVGIVTNNKDPESWGRVKVKFPTLTEDHESHWARVVGVGAADDRGFDCLPEVNDEVLVAFEHGDIHRPYILGGVWNGKDAPPEKVDDSVQDGKVRLRTVKTRTGHILQFVEEDKGGSKAGVYITTSGGHKVRINDSDRKVEIETNGGHKLTMDDNGIGSISMSSTGSISIDARTSIDIRANTSISINGNTISIKAPGPVTVQGTPIALN